MESDRGIEINIDDSLNSGIFNNTFANKKYKCDNEVSFTKNRISFFDEYKIEVPINNYQRIIIKSMSDVIIKKEQSKKMICSIFDETIKNGKPYQVFNNNI